MPLKVTETMAQNNNENWVEYASAEEMLAAEQPLMEFSVDSAFDMIEALDANAFGGRRNEILDVIKSQTITFDAATQTVTKVRTWPDVEAYNLYRTELWDQIEELHPGKYNYTKEVVTENI